MCVCVCVCVDVCMCMVSVLVSLLKTVNLCLGNHFVTCFAKYLMSLAIKNLQMCVH